MRSPETAPDFVHQKNADERHSYSRLQNIARTLSRVGLAATLSVTLGTGLGVGSEILEANENPAAAETGGYPYADAYDCSAQFGQYSWCVRGDVDSESERGFGYRNCTDWAAYRSEQLTGVAVPKGAAMGNANTWDTNGKNAGYTIDQIPEVGDIAQSDYGKYGHVGVVESVEKDSTGKIIQIQVSEYNGAGTGAYSMPTYKSNAAGEYWRNASAKWDNFIDLNGTGVGTNGTTLPKDQNGNIPYAAVPDGTEMVSTEGHIYTKVGGAAWWLSTATNGTP